MCGICGIALKDLQQTPDREVVGRMVHSLRHRGPDGLNQMIEPGVALGHTRLSIIDLTTGNQPIYNEDRTVAVIFNGEIYNFLELRAELEREGHLFYTRSDTEVLVHLWENYRDEMTAHLRGMYAFAIWDRRDRTLFLARDRAGQKPLVYMDLGNELVFASEIKALRHHPRFRPDIDYNALDLYLALLYIPAPWTIYKSIRKLPPAHQLLWKDGKVSIRPYWKLDFTPRKTRDIREWEDTFWHLFKESVRMRMISDVPLGAFLSGGIDSSLIVAVMSEVSSQPVKTFSMGFGKEINELPYARMVAQRFQTDHSEMEVNAEAGSHLEWLSAHYDEPYADTSNVPSYILSEFIRRHVTVALNGDGGDELFGGYTLTTCFLKGLRYRKIPSRAAGTLRKLASMLRNRRALRTASSLEQILWWRDVGNRLVASESPYLEMVFLQYFSSDERERLLRPECLDGEGQREFRQRHILLEPLPPSAEALRFDYLEYLPGDLMVKMDMASMIHGLEARSPFLDHKLTEHVMALPPEFKVDHLHTKKILKRMAARYLPPEILNRSKMGFGVPVVSWLQSPEMREQTREMLQNARELPFSPEILAEYVNRFYGGRVDLGYRIWQLLCYYFWHKKSRALSTLQV
ncbi:MAG: asparagine synthase (glutamine-hydrolyzing) [Deltaproteobacteria bacterium]|nr:asparagine synthase (glutamine-hydrolyzing) [Deltaproteobacteria bacterium]MBW2306834.1 asparagine synthase (glutamine-hydrolyzing) [Deltaproteobacteria bacterium]